MADSNLNDEISEIASQIRNHVSYFKEIGVQYLGGAAIPSDFQRVNGENTLAQAVAEEAVGSAVPRVEPGAKEMHEDPGERPKHETDMEQEQSQMDLFGEPTSSAAESATVARKRVGPYSVPALERLPPDASLQAISDDIGDCKRCKLCDRRTKIVFGEGNPKARLMFVGEGPGADEDVTGRPFVGRAGKLLDKVIASIGFRREEVYIANVVKCRPPENRTPERDEVATCEQFLFRQIACIKPRVIVALGAPALQCLFGSKDAITRSRGEWRDWNSIKVMATYHPAYLLRVPDKKRETWEDMKKVRDYLLSVD